MRIYSLLSFGWTGNAKAWTRFEEVSLVLGWFSNTTCILGTLHCKYGLRYIGYTRMAYHHFPTLLSLLVRSFQDLPWCTNATLNNEKGIGIGSVHYQKAHGAYMNIVIIDYRFYCRCGILN